jgi:carboxymethylenebutenolidase
MCDQDHFENDRLEFERLGKVTRKQFGIMLGAGIAMMLPKVANAIAVTESDVNVTTPDGTADCYFVHPATGRLQAFSFGRTFSAYGRHFDRWGKGSLSRAIRCLW